MISPSSELGLISNLSLFSKKNYDIHKYNLENIQQYLIKDIKIALECDKEDLSLMINYIIISSKVAAYDIDGQR